MTHADGHRWSALEGWQQPAEGIHVPFGEDWLVERLEAIRWPQLHEHDSAGHDRLILRRRLRLLKWIADEFESGSLPVHVAFVMTAFVIEQLHEARFESAFAADLKLRQNAWALEHCHDLQVDWYGWELLRDTPGWDEFEAEWHQLRQATYEDTFREYADPHLCRLAIEDPDRFGRYREVGRAALFGPLDDHEL